MSMRHGMLHGLQPVLADVSVVGLGVRANLMSIARIFRESRGVYYDYTDAGYVFSDIDALVPITQGAGLQLVVDKSKFMDLGPQLARPLALTGFTTSPAGVTVTPEHIHVQSAASLVFAFSAPLAPIDNYSLYEIQFEIFDWVSGTGRLIMYGTGQVKSGPTRSGNGVFRSLLMLAPGGSSNQQIRVQGVSTNTDFKVRNISVRKVLGFHQSQLTSAARPLWNFEAQFDGVDDALVTNLGTALGTNCTVVTVQKGGGPEFLTAQTVGDILTLNTNCARYLVIDRALTAAEQQYLTTFLDLTSIASEAGLSDYDNAVLLDGDDVPLEG